MTFHTYPWGLQRDINKKGRIANAEAHHPAPTQETGAAGSCEHQEGTDHSRSSWGSGGHKAARTERAGA